MFRGDGYLSRIVRAGVSAALVLAAFVSTGCHTIRPTAFADLEERSQIARKPGRICLVMDQAYRNYTSTDRGHWAADPQTYPLGTALLNLTEQYFRLGFESVTPVESVPADASEFDAVVQVSVLKFDNELTIAPTTQTLTIDLGAAISSSDGKPIGEPVHAYVRRKRSMKLLGSDAIISRTLSDTIQEALVQLVPAVQQALERKDRGL